MKKIFILFFILIIQMAHSQVYYGEILEVPESLDMTKIESYHKIQNEYGGLRFTSFGVIDFRENEIIFIDSKSSGLSEPNFFKMNMRFRENSIKNSSVFSVVCGELTNLTQFFMRNQNDGNVKVTYIPLSSLPLGTEEGGFFILNTFDKTYILSIERDDFKIISKLYR